MEEVKEVEIIDTSRGISLLHTLQTIFKKAFTDPTMQSFQFNQNKQSVLINSKSEADIETQDDLKNSDPAEYIRQQHQSMSLLPLQQKLANMFDMS